MNHNCNNCKYIKKLKAGYSYCRLSMLHIKKQGEQKAKECEYWEYFLSVKEI